MITNTLELIRQEIRDAANSTTFAASLEKLKRYLEINPIPSVRFHEIESLGFFMENEYSKKDNRKNLEDAKVRVLTYLEQNSDALEASSLLQQILDNFYLFLENLLERKPNAKAGIKEQDLKNLHISNEYDVQHLLYAYLKPIYPSARLEVCEDNGYRTFRGDIVLDKDTMIEIKCTRSSMSLKSLLEEIEADMTHYQAGKLYFFIYDKEKLISDPINFKNTYEKKSAEKEIHLIIHQPKKL